jgi:hypothetical protein
MDKRIILAAGDSWTFGSEIRDPALPPAVKDWDEENDAYRLPRTWPNMLASKLGITAVNIAYPGSSNDRIVRTVKDWLIKNYISKKQRTSELLLTVGFTSPERKDFYYKDKDTDAWVTIWPLWDPGYQQQELKKFHDLYVKHMWNSEEYVHRYINHILDLQNFCKVYGIDYFFFQAFYQHKDLPIKQWYDPKVSNVACRSDIMAANSAAWELIDDVRFMNKTKDSYSFLSYITNMDSRLATNDALIDQHPSEKAHGWWADHVFNYCKEKGLI